MLYVLTYTEAEGDDNSIAIAYILILKHIAVAINAIIIYIK